MEPYVGVIIVNYNRKNDLEKCIMSVINSDYSNFEILIVDNGSTDGSLPYVRERFPNLQIISNTLNLGFTGGNNQGMEYFLEKQAEFIFLLNNDAVVNKDAIGELVMQAKLHPTAGVFGGKILNIENPSYLVDAGGGVKNGWKAYLRGEGERDANQYDTIEKMDFVMGCAMLIRTNMIRDIGFFDEDYFVYHEEIDLCYRAKINGYETLYIPKAVIFHPDTRKRDELSVSVTYYITRNTLLFTWKHKISNRILFAILKSYFRTILTWTIKPKWKIKRKQRDAMVEALIDFFFAKNGRKNLTISCKQA